ncbi:MAG: 16S rRNA (cytidine(1402)-2'-O)-methyltransferase [Mycoplasma sp.]
MPNLKVIASPIGNLRDISVNFIETVNALEYLFCEDTRVIAKLLGLLEIESKPKLISYHKFNENEKNDEMIEMIKNNQCGLISDAGYPSLSDPGYLLINSCHENNIIIEVINGPSAINHSIVQSGFCSHGYIFTGFLDKQKTVKKQQLDELLKTNLPVVFFESVHRINQTIDFLKEYYSENEIYIGRELSKKFEQYFVGLVSNIPEQKLKGEFSLVIKPVTKKNTEVSSFDIYLDDLKLLLSSNVKLKDACKYIGSKNDIKTNELYNYFVKQEL